MIHRNEHTDNFTVISNDVIRNTNLSDGAVRLLAFMLSCADDWNFSSRGLAKCLGISEGAVIARVKELKEAGYIKLNKNRDRRGKLGTCRWDVYETPHFNLPSVVLPSVEKPSVVLPSTDEPHFDLPSEDKSKRIRNNNTKEISIERNIKVKEKRNFVPPTVEEVSAYCSERNNSIDPESFVNFYTSKGWMVGKNKMKDWKAAVRTWESKDRAISTTKVSSSGNPFLDMLKGEAAGND